MELTSEEKKILEQTYGKLAMGSISYTSNQIEEIKELTAEEERFFAQKHFISPYFSVQTLYKVKGDISPIKFNRAIHDMVAAEEFLRSNYCEVNGKIFKVVFAERRLMPEVTYRTFSQTDADEIDETLTKIMEADRRVNFDLKRGNLIRFSIFKTGATEFAVLITMSRLIAGNFDFKNFFATISENKKYKGVKKNISLPQTGQMEASINEYWSRVLKDFPPLPTLPYAKPSNAPYNPKVFRENIPADILSDLREKSKSSRVMLMSILQSAWGFFLQSVRGLRDVVFCQFALNPKGNENFNLNVIPVRQKSPGTMTVDQIVTQQFKQLVISQPYGFFDWDALQKLTKGKTFDHYLSFLDFTGTQTNTYSEIMASSEGTLVTTNSWDPQGMKLGVYFQYATTSLSITFLYDANRFFKNVGERFAKIYNVVLRQMLVHWHSPFATFIEKLNRQLKMEVENDSEIRGEDDKKIISNFIIQNPILQGTGSGTVAFFAESAQLMSKFEGDTIYGEILEKNLVFVVEGKVSRNLDTGDGWFKALDIISSGGWINENVFLEKRRTIISAAVLTERAKILVIPIEKAESLFLKHPDMLRPYLNYILKQIEKYQTLWINS